MVVLIPFTIGFILDLIFGDPHSIPHPVIGIGKLISFTENILRRRENNLKFKGFLLFVIVTGITFFIFWFVVKICGLLPGSIGFIAEYLVSGFIIFQILATKSLYSETIKVYNALKDGDLETAKKWLSYLVTRDCESMTEEDIVRSTIETISENIVDGITAPMFYIVIGGAPLGMFYKAVNTLDSMVGYKNERYLDFGLFSAKLDDIFNYIPARLTSIFIVLSSGVAGHSIKESFKILLRDRRNHSSPNSGYAEAPVAGALGIQLGGRVSYFGRVYNKPTMGDNRRKPRVEDIKSCHKIMFITSIFMFLFFITILSFFAWSF